MCPIPVYTAKITTSSRRIGIIADPQFGPRQNEERFQGIVNGELVPLARENGGEMRRFQEVPARYSRALDSLGTFAINDVVVLGDLTDFNPTEDFRKRMLEIGERSGRNIRHVIGNHDRYGETKQRQHLLPREQVIEALGIPPPGYYTFDLGDHWRGIIIDTTDGPLGEFGEGAISLEQLSWLEITCKETTQEGLHTAVFGHHPIGHIATNAAYLADVLREHTHTYMTGHHHPGSYEQDGQVHHINFRGMVNGPGVFPYARASFESDGSVLVHGFGGQPDHFCTAA